MPYKDLERKRQWEREHRDQRNARRRLQRLAARSGHPRAPKPAPDPVSDQTPKSTWKAIIGWAVGIGVVLLAAFRGGQPARVARASALGFITRTTEIMDVPAASAIIRAWLP